MEMGEKRLHSLKKLGTHSLFLLRSSILYIHIYTYLSIYPLDNQRRSLSSTLSLSITPLAVYLLPFRVSPLSLPRCRSFDRARFSVLHPLNLISCVRCIFGRV